MDQLFGLSDKRFNTFSDKFKMEIMPFIELLVLIMFLYFLSIL